MRVDGLLLIIYVLMALVVSFLCSVAESVLLSITPSYIEGQKERRPGYAALLKQLRQDNVDRSLVAIFTLNTIAHTVGAIGAGSKVTAVISALPEDMKILDSLKQVTQNPFSRLPLYAMHIDDITGFVLKKDVLINTAQKQNDKRLRELKREILLVPESISLIALKTEMAN